MDNLAKQIQRKNHEQVNNQTHVEQYRIRGGRITTGEKLIVSSLLLAVIFASFLVISNYANIYAQEKEISQLNQSISEQTQTNKSLELEVSELRAPERILHYAKEELGMTLNDEQVKVIQRATP